MKFSLASFALFVLMAHGADIVCDNGVFEPATMGANVTAPGNVVIPPGSTCRFIGPGTTVEGDIKVQEGSTCIITGGVNVQGKIKADKALKVSIEGVEDMYGATGTPVIEDDIEAKETATVTIVGAEILGDIQAERMGKTFDLKDVTIAKDVEVYFDQSAVLPTTFNLSVLFSTIGGMFKSEDSMQVLVARIQGNKIYDGIQIRKSEFQSLAIIQNTLSKTESSGDIKTSNLKIEENTIFNIEGFRGDTTGAVVVGNVGIETFSFKMNTLLEEFGAFGIFNNKAEKKIIFEENAWIFFANIANNCAGDTITVKKNDGNSLFCGSNKEGDENCVNGIPGISEVTDNTVVSAFDQCLVADDV